MPWPVSLARDMLSAGHDQTQPLAALGIPKGPRIVAVFEVQEWVPRLIPPPSPLPSRPPILPHCRSPRLTLIQIGQSSSAFEDGL